MAKHPDGPSKPFITTGTTSTFQIRRGRKPTLITEATRGETSSPVINNHRPHQRLPSIIVCKRHPSSSNNTSFARCPSLPATTSITPSRLNHVPPAFAEVAHVNAPCSYRLQHVVNVGSAVDDRRFALKAAAKATVPVATVPIRIFL
ncbi:hypothetical protein ACLOJK_001407 [Asimina triloba]